MLRYHLLDVFTDEPYLGNPLAVFVDPPALSDSQMQRIAGELNLSETVFTWSPPQRGGPWRTRIFTPASELPFAGHPTIGTASLLAAMGHVESGRVVLDEPVGAIEVAIAPERRPGEPDAWSRLPRAAERLESPEPAAVAGALRLGVSALHPDLPVEAWSAGVPFSIVPVVDTDALARSGVEASAWERDVAGCAAPQLYVVTPVDAASDGLARRWRARMFAPSLGIVEDPATGGAAAAFSGYLLARLDASAPADVDSTWQIDQGVEMGRSSRIVIHLDRRGAAPAVVRVGGQATVVGEGGLVNPPG